MSVDLTIKCAPCMYKAKLLSTPREQQLAFDHARSPRSAFMLSSATVREPGLVRESALSCTHSQNRSMTPNCPDVTSGKHPSPPGGKESGAVMWSAYSCRIPHGTTGLAVAHNSPTVWVVHQPSFGMQSREAVHLRRTPRKP